MGFGRTGWPVTFTRLLSLTPTMPVAYTRPHPWQKRSVLFGSLAMLIGAVLAFDITPAPLLYRVVLGLDLAIVAALGVLFVRLTRGGLFAE